MIGPLRAFALATSIAVLAACGGGGDPAPTQPTMPPAVGSVAVTLAATQLVAGTTTNATAQVLSTTGTPLAGRSVTWSSGNDAVATISSTGVVSAVAPGTAIITATSEGRTGTATLTVIPVPVASVTVSLAQSSLTVGSTTSATATLRSANGEALTGRAVVWSSSSAAVATVNEAGIVTTFAPGTTIITASSEGRTGSATLTVTAPPIASVTIQGSQRLKVGDTYQYDATARLADGTVVQRPVTWRVAEPQRGSMTTTGTLVATSPGSLTVQAIIDGSAWEVNVTAYDWLRQVISGSVFQSLVADRAVTNRIGQSEFPELVFVCSSTGNFFAWVSTQRFITENGIVAFSFDGGAAIAQTWTESSDFSTLFKPGVNSTVKAFANQVAGARRFGFAFGEFRGPTHVTEFRVTGLAARLAELYSLCPAGNPIVAPRVGGALSVERADLQALLSAFSTSDPHRAEERRERASAGPSLRSPSASALSRTASPRGESMPAQRRGSQ